jgi:phosphoribosyl-ATP pyrophosphohydrolase
MIAATAYPVLEGHGRIAAQPIAPGRLTRTSEAFSATSETVLVGCPIGVCSVTKPTKRKVTSSTTANSKKRMVKAGKPQRPGTGSDIDFNPGNQLDQLRSPEPPLLPGPLELQASPEVLNRLWAIIDSRKRADPDVSHSARLLARGTARVAQKLGEEAIECLIEAMTGNRIGLIGESADVLYHLLITWVHAGIRPEEVWRELRQRERVSYLTEGTDIPLKRLLGSVQIGTSKIP